ncbi:hypothetical protein [Parachlamydia sp. AcF125]|uniref:hypothetical protein n=1 Tax=Parachlamydia sp. AcF125 TaxID=2795736 RepID=UPI001BD8E548|nr:hypothetical protein [Parachlamydia sp. AcF125]MBS4168508.1 Cell division protein FtsQ [Parachlamydia sp. AcF125]
MKPTYSPPKIPLSQAIVWILLSTVLVSGSVGMGILYYLHLRDLRTRDDQYNISAIVQTTSHTDALKTVFLAELLDLSIDRPTNLYRFNIEEAKRKLQACSLIKKAEIKKIKPSAIWIDYSMRQPIAFLGDFTNTALDENGFLFPFKPFFTPKKLPEIFLGNLKEFQKVWGSRLKGEHIKLALSLFNLVTKKCCSESMFIRKIDVSKAYAQSHGQRQIVLVFEELLERKINGKWTLCVFPRLVRLNTEQFHQGLANYLALRAFLNKQAGQLSVTEEMNQVRGNEVMVDLRIPHLAYIQLVTS